MKNIPRHIPKMKRFCPDPLFSFVLSKGK